jgi:hypothetical protein
MRKFGLLLFAVLIGSLWLIGSTPTPAGKDTHPEAIVPVGPNPPSAWDRRNDAMKHLFFISQTHKGGFGAVLLLDGTLTNKSRLDIRDPQITCHMVASSGTSFGQVSATLYERITPGETIKVKDLNFGFVHSQAYGVGCRVTDLIATESQPPAPSATPTEPKAAPVKSTKTKQAKTAAK